MDRYAVVGHPVAHSKSPQIHAMFASQTKQSMVYERIEAPLEGFEDTVQDFFYQGGKGLNVTVPFKERAWAMCDHLTERARLAGAVNTLYLDVKGQLCGDNTDGVGLVNDLTNQGVLLNNKKVLVIGAGGAVKGVLLPFLENQPATITLTNRTHAKAEQLAASFSQYGPVSSLAIENVEGPYDLIINGTSASLDKQLPAISTSIFAPDTIVYDMMYAKNDTIFNAWARQYNVRQVIDGLGMLVEQAAEAFYIWRGVRPLDTQSVICALRD